MFDAFKKLFLMLFSSKPVSWEDVRGVVQHIEEINVEIENIKYRQKTVDNLNDFIQSEYMLQEKLKLHSALTRKKRNLIKRVQHKTNNSYNHIL